MKEEVIIREGMKILCEDESGTFVGVLVSKSEYGVHVVLVDTKNELTNSNSIHKTTKKQFESATDHYKINFEFVPYNNGCEKVKFKYIIVDDIKKVYV